MQNYVNVPRHFAPTATSVLRVAAAPSLGWTDDEVEDVRKRLELYAAQLAQDLDLAPPEVKADRNSGPSRPLQLFLNDQPCRLQQRGASAPAAAAAAAGQLCEALYRNRSELVSVTLAQQIRDEASARLNALCLPGLSRAGFRELLQLLAQRGLRVTRFEAVDASAQARIARWSPAACFEHAVSSLDVLGLGVGLCESDFASLAAARKLIEPALREQQSSTFDDLGLRLPEARIEFDPTLSAGQFRVRINDLRLPPEPSLGPDQFLVRDTVERLQLLGLDATAACDPATGAPAGVVDTAAAAADARAAGLATLDRAAYLATAVRARGEAQAGAFLATQAVDRELDLLRWLPSQYLPGAARERLGLSLIAQVLRRLLDEGIAVRDFKRIIGAMLMLRDVFPAAYTKKIVLFPAVDAPSPAAFGASGSLDALAYAECARVALKPVISRQFSRDDTMLCFLLDPDVEERLVPGNAHPLDANEKERLIEAVAREARYQQPGRKTVILTSVDVRPALQAIVQRDLPDVAIVSYSELVATLSIQPIGRIGLD